MTSPDNPFFKVSSGVDRTSRTGEPVKYGPIKETHKTKTDFRELLGAEERDPETAEEIHKIKDKSKSSKKSGKSDSPVTSRSKVDDSDDSNLSIFDLQSKQKPKVAKEVVKFNEEIGEEIPKGEDENAAALISEAEDIPIGMFLEVEEDQPSDETSVRVTATEDEASPTGSPLAMMKDKEVTHQMFKKDYNQPQENPETSDPIATRTTETPKIKPLRDEDTKFIEERPDLSSINPNPVQPVPPQVATIPITKAETPTPVRHDLQKLVTQIIDQIYIMKIEDRSETVITLKQPPLLEGARLTLTTYETARGQFNITFENLTQAAKNVLDMGQNRENLRVSLEKQGYFVHIMTTSTTAIENPIATSMQQMNQEREQQQQQQQREQEEQHPDEDET